MALYQHICHVFGNTGTHSAPVNLPAMLNGVHPRVCQVQPFVGWHCAGSDVDGVGSRPPHRWWIEQCCPLNLWKCGAEVWGGAGVCIEVAEAQAPFPFPQCVLDPEELAGVMLFAGLSVSEALQLWTHHSQRGRAPRRAETMPVPGWSHRLCFIL